MRGDIRHAIDRLWGPACFFVRCRRAKAHAALPQSSVGTASFTGRCSTTACGVATACRHNVRFHVVATGGLDPLDHPSP